MTIGLTSLVVCGNIGQKRLKVTSELFRVEKDPQVKNVKLFSSSLKETL